MLLLTGATGLVGTPLLRRLVAARVPVRCLVRDPKRLGPERVRVQIALGDLTDPPSFRNALRGVKTVVHLAGAIRDQSAGSIEELNGIATWRMVQAAERAGVEHFIFLSALGAGSHNRTRYLRAKALAERAVVDSRLRHTIVAPSLVYAPGDRWATLMGRLALAPVVPLPGSGSARSQPIWAEDVADCLMAIVQAPAAAAVAAARHELAGPDTLSATEAAHTILRAAGRERPVLPVPTFIASRGLRVAEALAKSRTPVTWDEAELLQVPMTTRHGTADAEALGVVPQRMAAVLGTV
ncbi:NAD(P)H-binding protein [Paraconexibacter antarcticus]|uniref:NAD(P)H-binding protein n=1 Tax=Paraconexibacter antarcticus TaxID=2949664 RepID=A0ABY5DV80_9ACTN|nr:NAD(P)H-binding protein [Paraconexibacter antarcticus]UTI64434.1 NAD(P)H-binding protein [Paraconexibacter antarcticus]